MLEGINKNAVTMKNNYDATEKEPVLLPSKIPNILVNLRMSIAVSESNRMPSHNLEDVCNSIQHYIKTKDIEKSIELIKAPDLPSGGAIIYDKDTIYNIYKTGKGSFTNLGKYKYDKETNTITIYEIPYTTYIENIEDEIERNLDKFSKELIDYHNGSDKDGLKLELYLKKNVNVNTVIQKLRKFTSFESKFPCNFTILDLDGKTPKLMSLEDIIDKWVLHRMNCIKNETNFSINKNKEELNRLYGLKAINDDLDKAIQIIRTSKTEKMAAKNLVEYFELNEKQAEYVSTIRLLNINQEWINNKIINISELEEENVKLIDYYNSEKSIKETIISQLEEIKKKFKKSRMTEIIYNDNIEKISETQLIEEYNTVCYLSKEGYFKKIPATSLRGSSTNKLKDDDEIIYTTESSNKSTILLFSNKGICYKLYQHEIDDCKLSNLGLYLPQQLQLDKDEQIISMVSTRKYIGYLIVAFENGKIAKIDMSSFKTKTMRSKLENSLNLESPMINMFVIEKDIDILLKSNIDKILVSSTSFINSKASKNTSGNQVQKQKNNSITELCIPLSQIDAKCIDVEYYKTETGKGIGNFKKKTDEIKLIK